MFLNLVQALLQMWPWFAFQLFFVLASSFLIEAVKFIEDINASADGDLLYDAYFGLVFYGTGTNSFVGSENGRRQNWKVGVLVNNMD